MRLGLRGKMRAFLLALGGVAMACSVGRVAGTGDDGGTSSSDSSSSSGGISSSTGGSSSGGISGSTGGSSSGGFSGSSGGSSSGAAPDGGDLCNPSWCAEPPSSPGGPTTTITTPHNYAVHTLQLGDTLPVGGTGSPWMNWGYDLDGKWTRAASTDVCTLMPGASNSVQMDGNGGADNSWGANILPILETLDSTFTTPTINNAIQAGAPTQLLYVVGYDPMITPPMTLPTATGLTGVVLSGAQYSANGGTTPTWDLNTHWPIAPESLSCYPSGGTDNCSAGTNPVTVADVRFPAAFEKQGYFVGGTPVDITLSLPVSGQALVLNIHEAIVTFSMPGTGGIETGPGGTIAGVLNPQELVAALQPIAGHISTSLCSGSAFQSIASQIEQAADIVLTGSTVSNTPGVACNGISIGLGFYITEIALPTSADIAPPQQPPPNPCAD